MINNISFSGGVHMNEFKEFSEKKPIEKQNLPKFVHIPVLQGTGVACEPLVKKGDTVKKGQLIGSCEASYSSSVHASISGTVVDIKEMFTAEGKKVSCISIESDGSEDEVVYETKNRSGEVDPKELVQVAKDAGIIGMGGGGFPFNVKLNGAIGKGVDSILANGAECEPFLTSDHRTMVEHPEDVVKGVALVVDALNADAGYIAVEDNKPDAIDLLDKAASDFEKITVASMITKYPQGDSARVIDSVLNRKVPIGERSGSVNAFVSNVGTFKALADAYYTGKPSIERVISVTGPGVANPKNILVKVGTPVIDLINQCGGFKGDVVAVISGGPMSGHQIFDLDSPVTKSITGIVVLTREYMDFRDPTPCIKCDRCIHACPVKLNPQVLEKAIRKENFDMAKKLHVEECIQCGSCSFVCPAKRHLAESIKLAINEIWARGN